MRGILGSVISFGATALTFGAAPLGMMIMLPMELPQPEIVDVYEPPVAVYVPVEQPESEEVAVAEESAVAPAAKRPTKRSKKKGRRKKLAAAPLVEAGASAGLDGEGEADGGQSVPSFVAVASASSARARSAKRPRGAIGTLLARSPKTLVCDPAPDTIEPVAEGRWRVQRDLVEHHTSSLARFMKLGVSDKINEDGVQGWKIAGFGCNSPLFHGGLRRGDIVLSVNDKPTRSMFQVYRTYRSLKRHSHFEVRILRKGEPLTLVYDLV